MAVEHFYKTLLRSRARKAWLLIATLVFISAATPSSYGLEFPMTSALTLPDAKNSTTTEGGAFLISNESATDQQVAALYATFSFKNQVSAFDLRAVSFASRQIELARTPYGAKQVALRIIRAEYSKWNSSQAKCLVTLWNRESHWNYKAHNYRSGAHGIAQAFPATKMESIGSDWRTNPVTQIRWGINYIDKRYGTPCRALARHNARGAY